MESGSTLSWTAPLRLTIGNLQPELTIDVQLLDLSRKHPSLDAIFLGKKMHI